MKKYSFLEKFLFARDHRNQFWAIRTLPTWLRSKIELFLPTTNLLASNQNPRLYSLNRPKQPFCRLRRPIFGRFWTPKRLLNQTKAVIYPVWHSFSQTDNLPQEAYLWI